MRIDQSVYWFMCFDSSELHIHPLFSAAFSLDHFCVVFFKCIWTFFSFFKQFFLSFHDDKNNNETEKSECW